MERMRVVAAVIIKDGKVLACRRAPHKSMAGFWEFPGGKVEPGESDEQALVREIREELSVTIQVGERLATPQKHSTEDDIDLNAYLSTVVGEEVSSSSDHDTLSWCQIEELRRLEWTEPDVPIVTTVISAAAVLGLT